AGAAGDTGPAGDAGPAGGTGPSDEIAGEAGDGGAQAGSDLAVAAGNGDVPTAADGPADISDADGGQQAAGRRRHRAATREQGPPESFAQPSPLPGFGPAGDGSAATGPEAGEAAPG
ncbi:MAG TPA: hypothetical protein VIX86_18365, partial [Streptosporangiaceae bacterium]